MPSPVPFSFADAPRTLAAALPQSMVRNELARLTAAGLLPGESREMAFSVCFADAAEASRASSLLEADGWAVQRTPAPPGFVTVHRPVPLKVLPLAWTVARLERLVAARGGSVAIVGAVGEPALQDDEGSDDARRDDAPPSDERMRVVA